MAAVSFICHLILGLSLFFAKKASDDYKGTEDDTVPPFSNADSSSAYTSEPTGEYNDL